jgi:CRP/FNR family cyclic AMP-dependent transcriptional regulator
MEAEDRERAKAFLRQIPLFGGLPDAALDRLLDLMRRRSAAAAEVICAEGDPAREMFIVRAGAVEVRKRARGSDGGHTCLARLRAGDEFGEMSLIDIQPRSATVVACEPTELYVLGNMDLLALYEADLPSYAFFLQNLCRELSRRLRSANGAIIDALAGAREAMRLAEPGEAHRDLETVRLALVDALGALDRAQQQLLADADGA